jgi:AAA family ATP:ADP antiporter
MSTSVRGGSAPEPPVSRAAVLIQRLVVVRDGELPALLASFATLFCMFCSYTIMRPIRDTMGITSGVENLPFLWWGTLGAMLIAQPVYGWLTSRLPRTVFLQCVYVFFGANLLIFYIWFQLQQDHTWIARAYYIWVSVFIFFINAVFWSLMADVFTREQAGRMFGFIAAGASTGGLLGPLLAGRLAVPLGTINLLLISAVLLAASLFFLMRVIRRQRDVGPEPHRAQVDTRLGGNIFGAFQQLVRSPYLLGIALFVVLLSWVSAFLYLEQQAFVARIFATSDERTRFFSNVDFWVQSFALLTQLFVFGRLFKWVGHRTMLVSVPVLMTVGYIVFALIPSFVVLVGVLAVRRVGEYSITRPCRDSLFTICSREEKYKAKSLIDTFIYRGGDATGASVFKLLTEGLGLSAGGVGWFGAFISMLWLLLAFALGTTHEQHGRPENLSGRA